MGNGKGYLNCYYCEHYQKRGDERTCSLHEVSLPNVQPSLGNQICSHFEASGLYWKDNAKSMPPQRRFCWFGKDLRAGVVYEFFYHSPEDAIEVLDASAKWSHS